MHHPFPIEMIETAVVSSSYTIIDENLNLNIIDDSYEWNWAENLTIKAKRKLFIKVKPSFAKLDFTVYGMCDFSKKLLEKSLVRKHVNTVQDKLILLDPVIIPNIEEYRRYYVEISLHKLKDVIFIDADVRTLAKIKLLL